MWQPVASMCPMSIRSFSLIPRRTQTSLSTVRDLCRELFCTPNIPRRCWSRGPLWAFGEQPRVYHARRRHLHFLSAAQKDTPPAPTRICPVRWDHRRAAQVGDIRQRFVGKEPNSLSLLCAVLQGPLRLGPVISSPPPPRHLCKCLCCC